MTVPRPAIQKLAEKLQGYDDRGALLRKIMSENECACFKSGVPCHAKCGCILEMEKLVDEQTTRNSPDV